MNLICKCMRTRVWNPAGTFPKVCYRHRSKLSRVTTRLVSIRVNRLVMFCGVMLAFNEDGRLVMMLVKCSPHVIMLTLFGLDDSAKR